MGAPTDYREWLAPLPDDISFHSRARPGDCDVAHLFVHSIDELDRKLPVARKAIAPDGAIWVSWHKKSSGIPTDITEDRVRNRALRTDLVDVKVCAVTEIWSGLKLVVRKRLR
ncbi:MAG TPA: hypothetical protein VHX61_20145 [Rhizomicrobium sp.]|nr:hypothetical protein [Rhizomicrobium sp.]